MFPTDKKVIRRLSFFFKRNFCFLDDKSYRIILHPEIKTIKSSVTYCTNLGFIFKEISGSNFKFLNSLISVYIYKINHYMI